MSVDVNLERKIALLEISVKDIDSRLIGLHREQAALLLELKTSHTASKSDVMMKHIKELPEKFQEIEKNMDKKISAFRTHANSVLDEIYDSVDELKSSKVSQERIQPESLGNIEDALAGFDKKLAVLAKTVEKLHHELLNGTAKTITELRAEIEDMKPSNVPTLIKDLSLEMQKLNNKFFVLEDAIKIVQKKTGGN